MTQFPYIFVSNSLSPPSGLHPILIPNDFKIVFGKPTNFRKCFSNFRESQCDFPNFRQTFGNHDATFPKLSEIAIRHDKLSGISKIQRKAAMKPLLPSSLINLSSLYQQIRDQAIQITNWPASQEISQQFERHNNVYQAPSFQDGNGPIALVALFSESENPSAVPLIQNCLSLFNQFIYDLCNIVTNTSGKEDQPEILHIGPNPESTLHLIHAKVPHICILVFQEHPSLLAPEQHIHWRSVNEATAHTLSNDLSTVVFDNVSTNIGLQLDSILLTRDGAMIAGFLPIDEIAFSIYQFIQTESAAVARNRLQTELTSRPKQLIHVTLGRVFGFRNGVPVDNSTPARVQELVRRYNLDVLPEFVANCRKINQHIWHLQHISLLRNTVWLCEENTIYRVWDLDRSTTDATTQS